MKNNILKKALGIITSNFGLKLLAVVVSCGLWFMVNSINDPIIEKPFNNIPVEIVNSDMVTDEGKVYDVVDGTDIVNVTVSGKRSIINDLTRDDIRAVADMSELTFMNTVDIKLSSLRNNSMLEFRSNINNMKLTIENIARDQFRINTSTSGEPAEGYVVGNISTSQNVVRVSGPESLIQQIKRADAVANIDGYSFDINTSVEIKLYDENDREIKSSSIKMNISTVTVAVSILATKEVPLSFTIPDEPAEGYIVNENVISNPKTIMIAGRKSVLETVSKISIADAALSVEDRTESMTNIINIKKYLPSGIQLADDNFSGDVSVTVEIEHLITNELRIPAKNFAAGSRPANFNIVLKEIENRDYYPIKISGTREAVTAVDAETIIGVVDMNQIRERLGIEEWAAGTYTGEITFNLPEDVTLAEPYMMTLELEDIEQNQEENE